MYLNLVKYLMYLDPAQQTFVKILEPRPWYFSAEIIFLSLDMIYAYDIHIHTYYDLIM